MATQPAFNIYEISETARNLTSAEKRALLQLREDGKGNYDPSLSRARRSLVKKGLADEPMALGFGRTMIACVQHPTPLGIEVQHYFGSAA